MRFVCLLVEHLPTRAERLLNPELTHQPLVILRAWDGHVLDASPEAVLAGVGPGDSRRRVEQLCPQAAIRMANETLYQSSHEALQAILANFSNAIETSSLGELFIEISVLARTFPSEKALALHITAQAQQATRLGPTAGIAANKFTAVQAARQAANASNRVVVVPEGNERPFLASLPIKVLPDPPLELTRRLHLFGITTLGGFAQLPHTAIVLQFGPEVAVFHDLARGLDPRPLAAHSPPPSVTRTLILPDPLSDRMLLLAALERLTSRLARALDESGCHAMALSLVVLTANREEQATGAPVKPPTAEVQHLRRLAGRLLGKLSLSVEVTHLTLTAYPLREWHLGARQLVMFEPPVHPKLERLYQILRMLKQRFGEAVIRLASALGPPLPVPIQVQAHSDGAPIRMRWGGWSRKVEKVYEYWRERQNWWDRLVARDYYQVESLGGLIFTIFRDGQGGWFLDRRRR